jgi:hypothetical protein
MRSALCVGLLASVLVMPVSASATQAVRKPPVHKIVRPEGIGVVVDQAKVVALVRPAKTIYVGNPSIADITVIDSRHAFVLGKTFGVTNLIALDGGGRQISNQQITVINGLQAVTYNLGSGQFNYSCTHAHCETMPRPGDATAYVTQTESAVISHEDQGAKYAASSTAAPAGQ